jgi:hypothetical protein
MVEREEAVVHAEQIQDLGAIAITLQPPVMGHLCGRVSFSVKVPISDQPVLSREMQACDSTWPKCLF